jgi:tetratricopeptide repeat protein
MVATEMRQVLGPDHPTTLRTATALTIALNGLGEAAPARALGEDTLQRCRQVLGPDHPITLYLTRAISNPLGEGSGVTRPAVGGR